MTNFIMPISIALGLFTYGLIAKWYLVPWMDSVWLCTSFLARLRRSVYLASQSDTAYGS